MDHSVLFPGRIVTRSARLWTGLRAVVHRRRVQLALAIRVTMAALASLALALFLHLHLPLWAVLTAVIVTQMNVGRALKTTIDYLLGTLGGAIYGGAIGVLIPHSSEIALLGVLALAVAPLALIAAINPRLSVAPITATACGAKNTSNGCCRRWRISCAESSFILLGGFMVFLSYSESIEDRQIAGWRISLMYR